MTSAKHTDGEWMWDAEIVPPDGPERYADIHVGDTIIAHFNDQIPEGRANARLIAAAPDLLEACRALDASWTESFPDGPEGECRHGLGQIGDEHRALWKQARAAIAKATEAG